MKLTCDLCGGALQMNLGGQGASCTNCGLTYSMARLREMLTNKTPDKPERPEPPKPVPPKPVETDIIYDVVDYQVISQPVRETIQSDIPAKAPETHTLNPGDAPITKDASHASPVPQFDFDLQQFIMRNNGCSNGGLSGWVQQGGIGLGDPIYLDGDYAHPYRVSFINNGATCVKAGMQAELFLENSPKRKILNNTRMVSGDPNPVANAYNYPGTVGEYFTSLLRSEFSQYEIRTEVPCNGLEIPISFLFYQGGKPVTAVFLIHSRDKRAYRQVERAAQILAPEGISCTYLYENYRNDMPYVIRRVRGALG